jgi:hypothetical protein
MTGLPNLNRRHKAGLLLTLTAVGASLVLDVSAKQTAGVVLLGLAAAWFIGSVRPRTLGLILCSAAFCVGLYISTNPVWEEWELYRTRAEAYDQALLGIREAVAKAFVWDRTPRQQTVRVPKTVQAWELRLPKSESVPPGAILKPEPPNPVPPGATLGKGAMMAFDEEGAPTEWSFPIDTSEEDIIGELTMSLLPRPTFSVKRSIAFHRIACLGGGSLSLLGLSGCVFLIWQARKANPNGPGGASLTG